MLAVPPAAMGAAVLTRHTGGPEALLVAAVGATLAVPLLQRALTRRFDPFEPITLFAVAWGLMFVVRPSALVVRDATVFFGVDVEPALARTLLLALLGATAFAAAYETPAGAWLGARRAAGALDPPRVVAGAVAVAAAAAAGLAVYAAQAPGGLDGALDVLLARRGDVRARVDEEIGNYPSMLSLMLVPSALLLWAAAARGRRTAYAVAALAVTGLMLVRTVPIGSRIALLPFVGGLFVYAYLRRRTRPSVPLLAALSVAVLFVSYVALQLRDDFATTDVGSTVRAVASNPDVILRPLYIDPDTEMAPALAGALTVIPSELPHAYGRKLFGDLVTRPVPRRLWPEKPLPPSKQVVAERWPDAARDLNPAFSPLLVLYWDFGLAGVLAGMALFGVLARALYAYLRRNEGNAAAELLFAVALWFVVSGLRASTPVDTFVDFVFVVGPLWAVLRVAGRLRPALPRAAPAQPPP